MVEPLIVSIVLVEKEWETVLWWGDCTFKTEKKKMKSMSLPCVERLLHFLPPYPCIIGICLKK